MIRLALTCTLALLGLNVFGCSRPESIFQKEVARWSEIAIELSTADESWFQTLEGNKFVLPASLLEAVDISPFTPDEFAKLTMKIAIAVPRYTAVQEGLLKKEQLGEMGEIIEADYGGVREALIVSNLLN